MSEKYNKEIVDIIFSTQIRIDEVLEKHGIKVSKSRRARSPFAGKKHDSSLAFQEYYFHDFLTGFSGDAVILDYYLETGGGQLFFEKGINNDYFEHKARFLNLNIYSNCIEPDFTEKRKEVEERKKSLRIEKEATLQPNANISKSFNLVLQYLMSKDRKYILKHLVERGLSKDEALKAPFVQDISPKFVSDIVNIVSTYGTGIIGLPGFFTRNKRPAIKFFHADTDKYNMFIPVYNVKGELISFHVRRLGENKDSDGPKYWSFSSAGLRDGCSPGTPTGLWGKISKDDNAILLTEGALKAYLIHCWTKMPVMYILGVGSTTHLEKSLKYVKETTNVKQVALAFDMDYKTNPNVGSAVDKIRKIVGDSGLLQTQLHWTQKENGLDDYIFAAKNHGFFDMVTNRIRSFAKKPVKKTLN